MNKGLQTEQIHYGLLSQAFENFTVSDPKGFAGGSDFIVNHAELGNLTFESKTANTDIFDAGVIKVCSDAKIQTISEFYSPIQRDHIQNVLLSNALQIKNHTQMAGVGFSSYTTTKTKYEEIKSAGGLINIRTSPPPNIIESSLTKPHDQIPKAHYVIIGDLIYRTSVDLKHDPLQLYEYEVPVLTEDHIHVFEIRTRRGGSYGPEKKVSVGIRLGYKLKSKLPITPLKLDGNLHQIIRAQIRKLC